MTILIGTHVFEKLGPRNLTDVRIVTSDLNLNGLKIITSVLMFVVKKEKKNLQYLRHISSQLQLETTFIQVWSQMF